MKKTKELLEKAMKFIRKIDFYIIMIICCVVIIFVILDIYFKLSKNPVKPKPYFLLFIMAVFLFMIPFMMYIRNESKNANEVYSKYEQYLNNKMNDFSAKEKAENKEQEVYISEENKDVINDMIKNNREIREYFKITKRQEVISYTISVMCAVFGVAILMYSVYAIFSSEKIESVVISVVSGAITEVVSGIVLWIHNKSAMQLNYYYDALHENEKFLSAISLADKLEKPKKEQMYEEIIRAQIRASEENKENEK